MDEEDHDEEDTPAREGSQAAAERMLVEQEADAHGADNLREPVDEIVE